MDELVSYSAPLRFSVQEQDLWFGGAYHKIRVWTVSLDMNLVREEVREEVKRELAVACADWDSKFKLAVAEYRDRVLEAVSALPAGAARRGRAGAARRGRGC